MNLSSIPFTSPVGKLLRRPLRVVPKRAVVPVLHGELRGRRWIFGSSSHGCWLGTYQHEKQRLLASLVPANGTVYDIGANVGLSVACCEPSQTYPNAQNRANRAAG